jgi:hypothetical protein
VAGCEGRPATHTRLLDGGERLAEPPQLGAGEEPLALALPEAPRPANKGSTARRGARRRRVPAVRAATQDLLRLDVDPVTFV